MHRKRRSAAPGRYFLLTMLLFIGIGALTPAAGQAANSAVILMYHRFGETAFPATNIRLEQFEAHIQELTSGGYTVLPVTDILRAVRHNKPLPERTIGITIDDGYRSIYEQAWPRLRKARLPFTVFISTDPIDQGLNSHLSWDQIREMRLAGVSFGAHTGSHLHMVAAGADKNRDEVARANSRMASELGSKPTLFAYPYGEAGRLVVSVVKSAGYTASFGQHSGVVSRWTNFDYVPRFALNEHFGGLSRFKLVANTLPLPAKEITPVDTRVGAVNPPHFGFTVAEPIKYLGQLNCFSSNEGRVNHARLGDTRIEVRMTKPFETGRTRINCTMPAGNGRWRWLGTLFVVPPR